MKRPLAIVAAVLGMIWLIATGVLLFYVAQLVGVPWLLGAFVAMDGAFGLLLAVYLVTNTRRPFAVDPYAQTTDELLRGAVLLPDGRPYGRREKDDRHVVDRLSEILEEEAAKHPPSDRTPAWAIEVKRAQADDAFGDIPEEDL